MFPLREVGSSMRVCYERRQAEALHEGRCTPFFLSLTSSLHLLTSAGSPSQVAAMQLRIETLEARLQSLTGSVDTGSEMITGDAGGSSSGGMATGFGGGDDKAGPSWASTAPIPVMAPPEEPTAGLDTFQGGLAVNAHGELRFYVRPSSSFPYDSSHSSICRVRRRRIAPFSPTRPLS